MFHALPRFMRIVGRMLCLALLYFPFAGKLLAADGFCILINDLPLADQTSWYPYTGGDANGGYMGRLFQVFLQKINSIPQNP